MSVESVLFACIIVMIQQSGCVWVVTMDRYVA